MNPTTPTGNQNQFFGQKVSKPGVNVNTASDNQLIYKNDFDTTTYYTSLGSLAIGTISGGGLGLQTTDNSGFVTLQLNGPTWYWYDKPTNTNIMQFGVLPDNSTGLVIAKPGTNISALFS